jgi:hypothetical protein
MQTSFHLYQNYGAFLDIMGAGITGPVKLKGIKNGTTIDLSSQQWTYQVSVLCVCVCVYFFYFFLFLIPFVLILANDN